jgi:hypothetical protein
MHPLVAGYDRIGFLGLPLLFNTSGGDGSGLSWVEGMEEPMLGMPDMTADRRPGIWRILNGIALANGTRRRRVRRTYWHSPAVGTQEVQTVEAGPRRENEESRLALN